MLDDIQIGPFTYHGGETLKINGLPSRRWRMEYQGEVLAEKVRETFEPGISQSELLGFFEAERSAFIRNARVRHGPIQIDLVDFENETVLACFMSDGMCGMTPGLINDSSQYWLRGQGGKYSRAVTISEFGQIVAEHQAPAHSWIAGLLPDEVLSRDAGRWRPPSSWELRHVVGEGSFTGVSGAKAAELVGVTPQNFRKYTARDGASTRQSMGFAMWHLLLHKLGVQKA